MEGWVRELLEEKATQYNQPGFIEADPLQVPHWFSKQQDIEIMGFWAAMLAWGQRKTIILKCKELVALMDGAPYDFILNHQEHDLKRFLHFKHRTFQATDALCFIDFFQQHYRQHPSLELAFARHMSPADAHIGKGLAGFHRYFFLNPDYPRRTLKHVATPERKSACKRLNMFLRWMVRNDGRGVDFGIWQQIRPYQLICPLDLHVERVARKLGLLHRKQADWEAALELNEALKTLDPVDPVRFDFALFGLGLEKF
jgi:uncharacterized protein (TIGR02757 family)